MGGDIPHPGRRAWPALLHLPAIVPQCGYDSPPAAAGGESELGTPEKCVFFWEKIYDLALYGIKNVGEKEFVVPGFSGLMYWEWSRISFFSGSS
ncbi:hypothetical protein KDA_24090 [Dictyobacter alpinus]|uniref:Uncharacterized protein n=1 Tax=Dictyobacter alpinus TaxID=2014873 RepID=A0A402B6F7_9CHLR|nr:hypothetical protein KDA_24090 [Dictyobacter alpinus]